METQKKKLTINTAVCDMTRLREESLAPYESITVNASNIMLTPRVKELLGKIPLTMNAAQIIQVEEGTKISTINGKAEIMAGEAPATPTMLMLNGELIIHPGSEASLKAYTAIAVNGKVLFPRSLSTAMAHLQVNGLSIAYPDEAILINGKLTVDALFTLRAKSRPYFVTGSVIMTDEDLDISALAAQGTQFIAKKAFIAQKLLKDALPMFDDTAHITPIPEGFAFVAEENTLSRQLISRYSKRLFFPVKLLIPRDQDETLKQLEGLQVAGSIQLPEALLDTLLALKPKHHKLDVYKGLLIADKGDLTITRALLDQYPEGLTLSDCGVITLDEAVCAQDILDKLVLKNCGAVLCHPAQEIALMQVSSDVGRISLVSAAQCPQPEEKEDPLHETVSTAHYQF